MSDAEGADEVQAVVQVLKRKAVSSLTAATEAFNSPHDDGRVTRVLLHLQHAFEMLLKAALVHCGVEVFDPITGRSLGFESCVKRAQGNGTIKLADPDAGTLRAIDAMRDDEQHWYSLISEQLLYLHARAGVTLFDELLQRVFNDRLSAYLPVRVLPVSVDPPRDLALVLDDEYSQIAALLQPGRHARHEARARIRTLLAMEAHVRTEPRVSIRDIDRVEGEIRSGDPRDRVFPGLEELATSIDGSGISITVHFTKRQGAPVVYVADGSMPAAGIKLVDLQLKYHRSATKLASDLGLTPARSKALRQHLGIDSDQSCSHEFVFGSQRHLRFSDNAYTKMREAMKALDMDAVWQAHKPPGWATCSIPGCRTS